MLEQKSYARLILFILLGFLALAVPLVPLQVRGRDAKPDQIEIFTRVETFSDLPTQKNRGVVADPSAPGWTHKRKRTGVYSSIEPGARLKGETMHVEKNCPSAVVTVAKSFF